MVNKTFGAAVYMILENMMQDTTSPTSIHFHRARRYLIDTMERLRSEEFFFTEHSDSFQSTAGVSQYDVEAKISQKVRRIKKLWYSDSATAELNPAHEDGVPQADYADVNQRIRETTANHALVEQWAWFGRQLYVAPRLDGSVFIFVKVILQPKIFGYTLTAGAFRYFSTSRTGAEQTHENEKIDDITDPTGWLEFAFQLLVAQTVRDLYLGPYQAKDPKKTLAESWIARRNEEFDRLVIEHERGQGVKHMEPYMSGSYRESYGRGRL